MLFQTLDFGVLLICVLIALVLIRAHMMQLVMLLVASYIFYMWWNPAYILLIVFSTTVDYFSGRAMGTMELGDPRRKKWLWFSVLTNLGLLGTFKYFNFFAGQFNVGLEQMGIEAALPYLNVLLPVGISFYTFQSMSYTIDVYRGKTAPERSYVRFATYVAFFPQLVAGPILRSTQFLPQLRGHVISLKRENLRSGFHLFLNGLVKKMLVADQVGRLVDLIFNLPQGLPSPIIMLGGFCFAVQIYADFSAYSDMAIGVARMMGFNIPINFNYPNFARSISEFWTRWHISLSTWVRDYLYFPLGGSRKGRARTHINLLITMLLMGIWHGAGWNFVFYGLFNGIVMVIERATGWRTAIRDDDPWGMAKHGWARVRALSFALGKWVIFLYLRVLSCVFFRVQDTQDLIYCVKKYVVFDFDFTLGTWGLAQANPFLVALVTVVFAAIHWFSFRVGGFAGWLDRRPRAVQWAVYFAAGFALFALWPSERVAYIYFQF
ncbi:MAG: Peptidoglycan O-acetyltransferase [Calditrichaeota bacterium]|nr:Peptidoglycan O-acetyltransferase [Calditrichota bacterium]